MKRIVILILALALLATAATIVGQSDGPLRQSKAEADAKSTGCLTCHEGSEPMHASAAVQLGCTDCHGGNAAAGTSAAKGSAEYEEAKKSAHVKPREPQLWRTSANPQLSYTALLKESPEFVKFVNPGDLRVAAETCGGCHPQQVNAVPRSTMTTSAVFWAAASYANGLVSRKFAFLGESYNREGNPQAVKPAYPPTPKQIASGARPALFPLPRWEIFQPGEYFRAFERGGITGTTIPPEIGNPDLGVEAGKPDTKLGNRGKGTGLRISPALINIHKTRLNDPHLSFLGTNEHPGDYRSSGCTACHVVYANDRDPGNSGPYAEAGNVGLSQTSDPTIPKDEKGHPIKHQFTRAVPTSQCMSCHMHQPNSFVNTYLGYIMWDYESDAALLWPKKQRYPTEVERRASLAHNPEGAAVRGLWTDISFLEKVSELNPQAKDTQFADYHGHGWNFMAVFKKDKKGYLLDENDRRVPFDDPDKFKKAVHLRDIHLEKGMHCADCHFSLDQHGDGQIYGEYGNAIEIECQDCHGNIDRYTNLRTSGPMAPPEGTDLRLGTTPFGQLRFAWIGGKLMQRSMLNKGMEWEVIQVKDTITPGNPHYSEKSRYAKTIQKDGSTWGVSTLSSRLAHSDEKMTCYACHTSWMTSCFGCHLPQEQNQKTEMQHYEGIPTRNYASYNPQVLRSDVIMLGINGTTKGHKVAPVRSSSALVISSTNALRQRIYIQQPPISSPGYSSQAFNAHVPHTVRSKETQKCSDCHVSSANDNNAWMAQVLELGTSWVNFIGRFAYVAEGEHGFEAIAVTEWDEPQAVIGSSLHKVVYPDYYAAHEKRKKELAVAHEHHGHPLQLQLRGEYLYTAQGEEGFEAFDVANVDNKDFSERLVSAPFSPIGQRTYVRTKYAAAFALPTNMPVDPTRKTQFIPENEEQPLHPLYKYAYIADKEEGLVLVDVTTLIDGNPSNNFFKRALTFNPGGEMPMKEQRRERRRVTGSDEKSGGHKAEAEHMGTGELAGSQSIAIAGRWLYMGTANGLKVIDIDKPLEPKIIATVSDLHDITSIQVQFRYAFVTADGGLHVLDVTNPSEPKVVAHIPIEDAHTVYVARTYAYVAAGKQGIVIVDVERPEQPVIDQVYNAEGELEDVHDVKVASTNASLFAYVADGEHGLKVVQLTSPEWTPTYAGFSPRPEPRLIAKRHTHGPALAISKGLDRDRGVDESGNQLNIFNRIGARPFNYTEMQRMYMRNGRIYTVSDSPTTPPRGE